MKKLVFGLLLLFALLTSKVTANHLVQLPLIPDTAAIYTVWNGGNLTWCLDGRASVYPNFRNQVQAVNNAYSNILGVSFTEVGFNSSCQIQHTMPESSFCSNCAADVAYANWPVTIRYKWQLGFIYWNNTIGHEVGHIFGLHEQYNDYPPGSVYCTYRVDTVMDCGSHVTLPPLGIWYPQFWFDMDNLTSWLVPQRISGGAGIAYHLGAPFAWYCGGDSHPNRADYTAIMYLDPNGAFYWSGINTPLAVGGDGCQRVYIYCYPGRLIYVNQQKSAWPDASQIWYLRNDILVGYC